MFTPSLQDLFICCNYNFFFVTTGGWSVELAPQPAGTDHSITVTDGASTLQLVDIAFGDVYICTGQSKYGSPTPTTPPLFTSLTCVNL